MRLTEDQYATMQQRAPVAPKCKLPAKGQRRRHVPGEMNKTEARFLAEYIQPRIHLGEFVDYWFEEWKFKLAKDTYYSPDFVIQRADGHLFLVDVKGTTRIKRKDGSKAERAYAEDDALVKIKVMPLRFPFPIFIAYRSKSGEWVMEGK